eukprot:GHVU01123537.1.p1 GENE.GHVU01123537.1~~GHVU01123537.1.p1  ORF type:complete len:186 (-),score=32.82 GHVU01123537.1:158-715(-)
MKAFLDPLHSLVIPMAILFFGGVPLPGGAVQINDSRLTRRWRMWVSLAGPIANFGVAAVIAILLQVPYFIGKDLNTTATGPGLAALFSLQIYACFLNMLPLPTLDGWSALKAGMPERFEDKMNSVERHAVLRQVGVFLSYIIAFFIMRTPVMREVADFFAKIFHVDYFMSLAGLQILDQASPILY